MMEIEVVNKDTDQGEADKINQNEIKILTYNRVGEMDRYEDMQIIDL